MLQKGKEKSGADTKGAAVFERLARDEKLRERVLAAVAVATAARRRRRRQAGLAGYLSRLRSDPALRAQLVELVSQLDARQGRAKKAKSHKVRNTTLALTGAGLVVALAGLKGSVARRRRDEWSEIEWPESTPAPATNEGGTADAATP
jgi:hypothetical protein